ncbi:MAG: ornithine cyclodeaminase family protein [Betaproteobacteria bacterium]|jgi:ornithine cyclodeaminase|nr:ornithine cyclodeaminase family protein [Betaproteobacteria bacterium]
MALFLNEDNVKQLITMPLALEQVERALRDRALGKATDLPRARIQTAAGIQHMLQAAAPELGYIGFKYYFSPPGKRGATYVHLISMASGKLEAIVEAVWLGMMRTGAASGVASKVLANPGATMLAQIGAGFQGMGQLEAVVTALNIREARVYARTRDKLEAWCKKMGDKLGIPVLPAHSAPEAIAGAQVVNIMTKSTTPVIDGDWLEPGQHVNAAGSNALSRREIDAKAVSRATLIAVDSRGTARNECGDLIAAVETGKFSWDVLPEIGEILTGRTPGRRHQDDITLYESHGMGIQDIYTAAKLVELARARKVGTELPM